MTILYGISNCDTVRKARRWLEDNEIDYRFHDFRNDGLSPQQIETWIADLGLERLVNKRSSAWKQLTPEQRDNFDEVSAAALILEFPNLIRRPLLEKDRKRMVGFSSEGYEALFKDPVTT